MSAADWVDDIAQYLDDEGVGVYDPGTGETVNVFVHRMQESPVACLCLYAYAGRAPGRTLDRRTTRRPGLQIVARGATNAEAKALLDAACAAIDDQANVDIGAHHYLRIRALGSSTPLGWENGSTKLSQNFETEWR